MICFQLAETLNKDIEDIMGWSYRKINWWLAYYDLKKRRTDSK